MFLEPKASAIFQALGTSVLVHDKGHEIYKKWLNAELTPIENATLSLITSFDSDEALDSILTALSTNAGSHKEILEEAVKDHIGTLSQPIKTNIDRLISLI